MSDSPGPPGISPFPRHDRIPPVPAPSTSGKAIAAFLLALFGGFLWIFAALPAIVLALAARSDIRASGGRLSGRGLANAALLLGILGLFVPPALLIMAFGGAISGTAADADPDADRIAHIHLAGALPDMPTSQAFEFLSTGVISSEELVYTLRHMASDESVKALIITTDAFFAGAAQTEEISRALVAVKDAGKPVYAHAGTLQTGGYALLSCATQLNLAPTEILLLTGLYMEGMYLGDALEKLHAKAEVVHIGDYKSAGESLTRSGPSEPALKNMNWLLDDLYLHTVEMIASGREFGEDHVRHLVDGGPYHAEEARALGLVDSVQFIDEFLAGIREQFGEDVPIDDSYLQRVIEERGTSGIFSDNPAIGVITISGMILPGYGGDDLFGPAAGAFGETVRKRIDRAAKDDSIAAIVIRVDSPGGSATASEVMLRAVKEAQKRKPVVISMGNTAASGGYYVACSADAIFANPSTVTASIGVVGGKIVTSEAWEEYGINWHPYARGANADIFSSLAPFTETQRERIRTQMEAVFASFRDHVREGRADKLTKPLANMTGGRVFTGAQALELGLIDEIGGLHDAIEYAAGLAEASSWDVIFLPEPKDFMTLLLEDLAGTGERSSDLHSSLARSVSAWAGNAAVDADPATRLLRHVDPARAHAFSAALSAAELFRSETVLALMPEILVQP